MFRYKAQTAKYERASEWACRTEQQECFQCQNYEWCSLNQVLVNWDEGLSETASSQEGEMKVPCAMLYMYVATQASNPFQANVTRN